MYGPFSGCRVGKGESMEWESGWIDGSELESILDKLPVDADIDVVLCEHQWEAHKQGFRCARCLATTKDKRLIYAQGTEP